MTNSNGSAFEVVDVTVQKSMKAGLRDALAFSFLPISPGHLAVEWRVRDGLTDYQQALNFMQDRVNQIHHDKVPEMVWLVEHPSLYTSGTSAQKQDLLKPDLLPVYAAGRGGEYTYHGPGQRVAYIMLDLKARRMDVRAFVSALEEWIIRALAAFGVVAERREDRVGVWISSRDGQTGDQREDKIAAIGIRLKRWVSFHGIAVNITPDLSYYQGIVPCGIKNYGVTSLGDLGLSVTMQQFDASLAHAFTEIFGKIEKFP